ncbi:hypothetical protein HMPREF9075_01808, partial [Capnocytophaga sp. oral taxon 332 str. F0381]
MLMNKSLHTKFCLGSRKTTMERFNREEMENVLWNYLRDKA